MKIVVKIRNIRENKSEGLKTRKSNNIEDLTSMPQVRLAKLLDADKRNIPFTLKE